LAERMRVIRGIIVGAVAGTVLGLWGFFLVHRWTPNMMGATMFIIVPMVSGFAIAMIVPPVESMIASAGLALLVALGLLVADGREGVLCAILAFPILLAGTCAGLIADYLFRDLAARFGRKVGMLRSVMVLLMALVIVAGRRVEVVTLTHPRQETVTTTIHLPAALPDVWANIQSLDRVAGREQPLMYVGLPIPLRCVMQGSGAGAKRTCYFDQGYIEETVLEWSPPNRMVLSIDRTNMPGRHWLDFEGAEYELHREGTGTALTRATTISSNLYPSWYWRRFELWGVASEHEYLLSDLARRFSSSASESQ
jgi:hypothetical protein